MHEMAFAEQILEGVQRAAEPYAGSAVTRVRLRAGERLALEPASLRFCLEAISVGTCMEGAQIELNETGPELECPACGRVEVASVLETTCPHCGQACPPALGTELFIEEIELDDVHPGD
jgi:hydrogenase nickel incorporation protein HypA/HybF